MDDSLKLLKQLAGLNEMGEDPRAYNYAQFVSNLIQAAEHWKAVQEGGPGQQRGLISQMRNIVDILEQISSKP